MGRNLFVFIAAVSFSLTLSAFPCFSMEGSSVNGNELRPGPAAPIPKMALSNDEIILARSPTNMEKTPDSQRSYFVEAGGTLAIYDEDFREFLDYGASITLGIRKAITKNLSILPSIGAVLLNGDWNLEQERESILVDSDMYFPGFIQDPDNPMTVEDLPDANLGTSYHGQGEATITSSELLRHIDLETSLYLFPVSLNVVYRFGEGGRKITPYLGGGVGVCLAVREVESRTIKEKSYNGPDYRLTYNDNQRVTGEIFQLFGGIEIPVWSNMMLTAQAATTLYDLRQFKPILEISASRPTPSWYQGSDLVTWSYEDPIEIGVFREEFITTVSIGALVPF